MLHTADAPQRVAAWRAALTWMGSSFLACCIGLSMFFRIGWGLEERLTSAMGEQSAGYLSFLAGGVVCGAILAAGAWPVVRHRARPFWAWMLLSAAGFSLGGLVGLWIAMSRDGDLPSALLGGAVIGLVFGTAQWLALRGLRRSGWWPLANALAVSAAFWCAVAIGGEGRENIALIASSLAYAAITAVAAAWILGGLPEIQ